MFLYPGRSDLSVPRKGLPVGPCFGRVRITVGGLRSFHCACVSASWLAKSVTPRAGFILKIRWTGLSPPLHRVRGLSFCRTNLGGLLWKVTCLHVYFRLKLTNYVDVISRKLNISNFRSENKQHFKVANVHLYEELH